MRSDTHRRAVIIKHRARGAAPNTPERNDTMESYKNQIIQMLETIQDAKLMRMIYEVLKAILMNR